MADFLLELRCEEIPARMQAGARVELEKLFRAQMEQAGVSVGDVTVWSTPRRLALIARDLPTATKAVREEAKGPPVGAPDQAVDGFCRKNGVTRDQLEERDVKGRATWFAVIEKPGQAVSDLLAQAIPSIIRAFSWPKSMRWGAASISSESTRWVRPLSGIVALIDGEVVPVVLDGIAAGRETMGHRFHSSGPIAVDGAGDYADKLRAAYVIVDHEARADMIRAGARQAAEAAGLSVVEDEGLVTENAGLTEWPVPLLGRFDEQFLTVPPEVIQLTARVNQKYFVCEDADGKLANAFICTANIDAIDPAVVVDGNRKVLAARLSDARFFWEQDQKKTLAQHAEGLARITFHEKLGTLADKVERVAKLARWLCEEGIVTDRIPAQAGTQSDAASYHAGPPPSRGSGELAEFAEAAARLCKADLVTEMVGEFPELQGLMGGYYASKEGLPVEVADAIRDHYKPVGQGDDVPTAPVTVAVSLADKFDTVIAFFAIAEKPTGSKDPFALRRAALGIMRILLEQQIRLRLTTVTTPASKALARDIAHNEFRRLGSAGSSAANDWYDAAVSDRPIQFSGKDAAWRYQENSENKTHFAKQLSEPLHWVNSIHETVLEGVSDLLDFFADRLKVQQREAGVRHDLIDAVFALGGEDDLVRLLARVHALQAYIETENGANLLAGYKRAANILKKGNHLVTPANAGVHGQANANGNMDSRLRGNDDGLMDGLGEEDPLALAGKPEFDEAFREPQNPSGRDLSYSPEPAEKALIDALDAAGPKATAALEAEDFEAAMEALASLRAPIDRFFEDVIVNAPEKEKREARLALLARFRDAVHRVADFSRIEG